MPTYVYQCDCGIRFEKQFRFEGTPAPPAMTPCPDCGEAANRLMPETASGVFKQQATGPVPQNTGISSFDAHVDRVIGQSAAQGWAEHEVRQKDKQEVVEATGANPHALARNPDGSWRPLTDEERGVQVRAQKINSLAIRALDQRRRKRPAPVGQA